MISTISIFAQETPASTQGWVALIVQTGAIGILGWHLLFGLPKMAKEQQDGLERMLTKISETHERSIAGLVTLFRTTLAEDRQIDFNRSIEDRKESAARNKEVVAEIVNLKDAVPKDLGVKFGSMLRELETQTGVASTAMAVQERQTAALEHVAKKMEDWPSDADKVCKAEMVVAKALRDMGLDPRTVEKLLEVKRRQREREAKSQGKDK